MTACRVLNLGLVDYSQAWELQRALVQKVARGERPNTLLLLEHPHVYTLGRLSRPDHILLSQDALQSLGVQTLPVDRGGQVTYHGPGQLVAYPIVNLRPWGGPLKYVRALEQVMIRTLADFNIKAGPEEGLTGVWVGQEKIGAIGVKITQGVAHHGLSLNVAPDLDYYRHIVPCGIGDRQVTSMARALGKSPDLELVAYALQFHFGNLLGFRMEAEEASPTELLEDLGLSLPALSPGA